MANTAKLLAYPGTDDWAVQRLSGIGASEAAAACGLSPYETPLHVYLRKIGEMPPVIDNLPMRAGRRLEPLIVEEFQAQHALEVQSYPAPLMRHSQHPFMLATPDAMLCNGEILECKSTSWMMAKEFGEDGSDNIPETWLLQVQQQMAVTGAPRAHVAVLVDGRELRTFVVVRQVALIERLVQIEADLWRRIQDRQPPEPDWTNSATHALVANMHQNIAAGRVHIMSDEARQCVARRKLIAEDRKLLKSEDDLLKARIQHELGDAEIGDLGDGFAVRRKIISREPYTAAPAPYVELRQIKWPSKGGDL